MTRLERYFHRYNDKYFGGELPEPIIRWADLKHYGQYYQQDGQHIIELAEWTRKKSSLWRWTLLHELVHLKLHNRKCKVHGRVFHNEMKRLAAEGAFIGLWQSVEIERSTELCLREPWRCSSCQRLMYNLDPGGYPCRGAPIPLYADKFHIIVCNVCYEMAAALDRADWTYWRSLPPTKNKVKPDQYHQY